MNLLLSVRQQFDRYCRRSEQVVVYPIPVKDALTLHNAKGRLQFISTDGQIIRTVIIDSNRETTLSVATLPAGAYLLQIVKPDGTVVFKKVMKD